MPGRPEEPVGELEPEESGPDDIDELKKALAEEKEKAGKYLASWQRAQADFINYKRRSEQETAEFRKLANSALILNLLPVLDDIQRALEAVPAGLAEEGWVDGVRLIAQKFGAILETQGLTPIEAVGQPFDPRLHEAVRQDNGEEGIIIAEILKGYKFHDRVIRPSRVVVGNGKVEN